MKTIYILRSVESEAKNDSSDYRRTLTHRGFLQITAVGKIIFDKKIKVDKIISSTTKRTRITSALIKSIGELATPIVYDEKIYGGDFRKLVEVICDNCDDSIENILLVCHNPGAEMLIKHLLNKNERMYAGSFIKIELDITSWTQIQPFCGFEEFIIHQSSDFLLWFKHFIFINR